MSESVAQPRFYAVLLGSFAAIALIWIFKTDVAGRQQVPIELLPAALCAVGGLATDFAQYFYASLAWGYFQRKKEMDTRGGIDDFLAPRCPDPISGTTPIHRLPDTSTRSRAGNFPACGFFDTLCSSTRRIRLC